MNDLRAGTPPEDRSEAAVVLEHHLLAELQVRLDLVDRGGLGFETVLNVITVLLLRVVRVDEFLAADPVDLLEGSAVGLEFLRDLADHFVDGLVLALEFEDVDSFVFAFHGM